MSTLSEQARDAAREKTERLLRTPKGDVDASGWREPLGEQGMQSGVQTGPRPVSRRQFRRGGKVQGEAAAKHLGRKPRAAGGVTKTDGSLINTDIKARNDEREGPKHVGGMKRGGKVHGSDCTCAKCGGGEVRAHKATGGASYGGTRPTGGRIARKSGGRSKKGMNVNIIIAPGGGGAGAPKPMPAAPPPGPIGMHQGMPPPMPPPGAMPPGAAGGMPPPGMPMPRKSGGRTGYPISNGAGGGKGRLEKIRAYG